MFSKPLDMDRLLKTTRASFSGFNSPADADQIEKLTGRFGSLPDDIHRLYCDHDGQDASANEDERRLPGRLMSIEEVLDTNEKLASIQGLLSPSGTPAFLWTDDQSNYAGVYIAGPLQGWVTILDHENQSLVPSFQSVKEFYRRMIASASGMATVEPEASDLPSMSRQFPLLTDDPATLAEHRALVELFSARAANETDDDIRRVHAKTAICLTPAADTATVTRFFHDSDMWIPESAVCLIEFRKLRVAITELEQLAVHGRPSGDSAAMRTLVRMGSKDSLAAINRLKESLPDRKRKVLEQWIRLGPRLTSPTWS